MARHKTWITILSDLVRDNPRTSAMIAFNLGVWAGQATQKRLGKTDLSELPAKLVDMMPSMKEMSDYVPALPSPIKALAGKPARRGSRKAAVKSGGKTGGRRKPKRGAARRKAA
jgi:hypothetical protein